MKQRTKRRASYEKYAHPRYEPDDGPLTAAQIRWIQEEAEKLRPKSSTPKSVKSLLRPIA